MIHHHSKITTMTNNKDTHNPPSYDVAVSEIGSSVGSPLRGPYQLYAESDVKVPPQPEASTPMLHPMLVDTSTSTPQSPAAARVYHYQNPETHETIASLLPPDHPSMVCLQRGEHLRKTRYGIVGILTAVLWFPLGVAVCMLDRKTTCKRCGAVLREGIST